jgi:pimeloyl-ACP methyl ester carboxylesterase
MRRRVFFRWLKVIILLYSGVGIALYYLQERILFHPEPLAKNTKFQFPDSCREINIPYDAQTSLNILSFTSRDPSATGVVLYFHGNSKNISWYAKYAQNFTKKNYEVLMLDYPGFGKSTGKFTEERLYDYALQVYRLARARFKPTQIIIYGKSLGTCVAAQLASVRDCRYLILETPCYSMTSLVERYFPMYPVSQMLHYHFPTNEYLKQVTAPVIIFQGTDDKVIPYRNAARLKQLLKPGDEFVTIPEGSHNDLGDFPVFHRTLDSLLR